MYKMSSTGNCRVHDWLKHCCICYQVSFMCPKTASINSYIVEHPLPHLLLYTAAQMQR